MSPEYRVVGRAAFSSMLRYCCSQDKHWGWICDNVAPKALVYRNAIGKFNSKLDEYAAHADGLMREARAMRGSDARLGAVTVEQGDAVQLLERAAADSVDLVVTSPPYFNMTDYVRSQRLTLTWLGEDLFKARSDEIGARFRRFRHDARSAYVDAMRAAAKGIARVLKPGHFACIVLGESPQHPRVLSDVLEGFRDAGLPLIHSISRRLPKQRALSPVLNDENILIMKKAA